VDHVNYYYMFRLARHGVNFYLEPTMNHAKVMIIDGKEGIVGSQNLDFISFDLNSEIGVFFKDESVIRRLTEIVERWQKDTELFNNTRFHPTWFDYILSPLLRIFSEIL
jgi:phosphatidylserine/phosphatidylglycerophosphate/cardiolipin synthase-like enzyme